MCNYIMKNGRILNEDGSELKDWLILNNRLSIEDAIDISNLLYKIDLNDNHIKYNFITTNYKDKIGYKSNDWVFLYKLHNGMLYTLNSSLMEVFDMIRRIQTYNFTDKYGDPKYYVYKLWKSKLRLDNEADNRFNNLVEPKLKSRENINIYFDTMGKIIDRNICHKEIIYGDLNE